MCANCRWMDIAAAITANLETRDRRQQTTFILEQARDIIVANEHVTPILADAVEAIADQEGWAVA